MGAEKLRSLLERITGLLGRRVLMPEQRHLVTSSLCKGCSDSRYNIKDSRISPRSKLELKSILISLATAKILRAPNPS